MDEGDRERLLALMPRLRRFAIGLAGSAADGDDLVQATYERALRYFDSWQPGTRLDSWLYRIARNLYLNEVRARGVRGRHLQAVQDEGGESFDGQRAAESRLLFLTVRRFIDRLPEEQRAALLLVAVDGMSYGEAAGILEVPVGTITSRVARARIALRRLLDGDGNDTRAGGKERDHG